MSDETNEVTIPGIELPQKYDSDVFDDIAKAGDYLPRVQVMGGNSGLVQRGEIAVGLYALVHNKDKFDNLTQEFDCFVLSWRPKCMDTNGDQPLSLFNHESEQFIKIKEKAGEQNSGCMYGPEYLVYLKGANCFATFFFSSKSSRREAPNMQQRLGKAATCKIKLIETKKFSWHSPVIVPCTTPFDAPDPEAMKEQLEKFNNPPESEVETVDATDTRER